VVFAREGVEGPIEAELVRLMEGGQKGGGEEEEENNCRTVEGAN